uniref:Uncharacterized protein n=1 Tax=Gopherus agassizii TaxID=38772 RepID=A0A452IAS0_9SAUR
MQANRPYRGCFPLPSIPQAVTQHERDAIRNKYSNCLSTCTNMIQQDLTDITLDPQPNYNAGLKGDSIIYHCTNASQGVDVPGHAKREVECSIRSEVLRSTCSLLTDWPKASYLSFSCNYF